MPPSYARIAPIEDTTDLAELVRTLNDRINEVNTVFTELETAEGVTRGSGGLRTTFESNPDINNFRLTNVAPSKDPQDAITRKELDALGLLPDTTGELQITVPVNFNDRVTSSAPTTNDGQSFATINNVIAYIEELLDDNVASSRDGERVTVEDAAGANGRTKGTPIMGRDGKTGKARHLQANDEGLLTVNPRTNSLLEILTRQIEEITQIHREKKAAVDTGAFVTLDDVQVLIDDAIGDNVAVAKDGELVSIEGADGTNGVTQGTPIMARDGKTGKARHLQSNDKGLVVDSTTTNGLLEILILTVEELTNELRNRG